jgi:two-component system sensor histidine kinase/response regulator
MTPRSETYFRDLVEAVPGWLWGASLDGSIEYFSAKGLSYAGVTAEMVSTWGWVSALHPDDRAAAGRAFDDALSQQKELDVLARFRRYDGDYTWLRVQGALVRDAAGSAVRWAGSAVDGADIAKQRKTEEEIDLARRAQNRFELAIHAARFGVWEFDMPDGNIDNAKSNFFNIWEVLGYDPSEAPEQFAEQVKFDTMHPDQRESFGALMREFLKGPESHFEAELRQCMKGGEIRTSLIRGIAVREPSGKPTRFAGSVIDISELKATEAALRDAQKAAEAANRAKGEFLANVSHEIRTPMNAILGMTELTLDSSLTEHQRSLLNTVKSAADGLLVIINDLLDFSKIEAGKLEIQTVPFSLRSVLGETMRALATRAHRKGLELVGDVRSEVPDALLGDPGRLRQVLLNVVGNAIKFTDQGEVIVTVDPDSTASSDARTVGVIVNVRDTGIGISPDMRTKIFRAFEQEDSSTTRRFGGTGLGLSIASHLVSLMGGAIRVDSQPGRGSTFAVSLRFALQTDAPRESTELILDGLRDLRTLVIDDNTTNRHILEEWLASWRMKPFAVGDGLGAMGALWDAAGSEDPYSLILLDSRMPDTDGWALAARIRERSALVAVRIIMLASADLPGDPTRARELGIDSYLLKPVSRDELLETIYRVMSNSSSARREVPVAQPARRALASSTGPLRILVAEDDQFSAQLMVEILAGPGHHVRVAKNGRDAAALAGPEGFDILFLDLHMPGMDGFEVARVVREREGAEGGHLPIVALTARSRKEDHARCLAAGMDDFLTKPIRSPDLFAALERLAKPKRAIDGEPQG